MSSAELETLRKIARRTKITQEIQQLQEKKEEYSVRADLESTDFSKEIAECDGQITTLQTEQKSLTGASHKIELAYQEFQKTTELMTKLTEKKATLTEKVYQKLYSEYLAKKDAVKKTYLDEYQRLDQLKREAELKLKNTEEAQEEISARAAIGDISQAESDQKLQQLVTQRSTDELVSTAISALLAVFSKDLVK